MVDAGSPEQDEQHDDRLFSIVDPLHLFAEWYAAAQEREPNDPGAMALATVTDNGVPNVRMVLLKAFDERGYVFYTNLESDKGHELRMTPNAALCFHWKSLRRQVRIQGPTEQVTDEEADAYFATRSKDSQIGAWASKQSRPLESRFALEKAAAKYAAKYAFKAAERPSFWSGYRIMPLSYEFWRHRPFRLHDRRTFIRNSLEHKDWRTERLYP